MSPYLQADFSNARVGDRVKCLVNGEGRVVGINNIGISDFLDIEFVCISRIEKYSREGLWIEGIESTLYYHFEGQFPTIESCKRPLPNIEKDEKVLIYTYEGKERREYFKKYNQLGGVIVYGDGQTSWSWKGTNIVVPKYWKLESDETINSGNLEEI